MKGFHWSLGAQASIQESVGVCHQTCFVPRTTCQQWSLKIMNKVGKYGIGCYCICSSLLMCFSAKGGPATKGTSSFGSCNSDSRLLTARRVTSYWYCMTKPPQSKKLKIGPSHCQRRRFRGFFGLPSQFLYKIAILCLGLYWDKCLHYRHLHSKC